MTSTSFNVGLGGNSRLSSRVLRPPGGGHTDIFGGEPDAQPQTPRRGPPASSGIAAIVAQEEQKPTNGEPAEAPIQNGQNGQTTPQESASAPFPGPEPKQDTVKPDNASPPASQIASEPVKVEAPKRVRVPPGGFSSGLW